MIQFTYGKMQQETANQRLVVGVEILEVVKASQRDLQRHTKERNQASLAGIGTP